jgi:hypothetical protein
MVKYNKNTGAILGKNFINKMFGRMNRTDQDCWDIEGFVHGSLIGSGYEYKNFMDIVEFNLSFDCFRNWYSWWENRPDKDTFAVVEKYHGVSGWSWVKNSKKLCDWSPCFFRDASGTTFYTDPSYIKLSSINVGSH